ncbi:MAG TPA: MarR family winged helix-turn-helix transcriptional regulator [Polyangiaceae bacterium]|nr:MarR family winged helix-turn-helix transcriptional regulator [Polyangiaceae bacterium]
MPSSAPAFPIDLHQLAVTHLASFVGTFANQYVLQEMKRAGFGDLREAHGFLVQHLLRGPHSVGELGRLMGVTQQAVSKTVAELTRCGYLETQAGDDARVRLLRLSERGHASVLASRKIRDKLERRLSDKLGPKRLATLRAALGDALQELGGVAAVKGRRVPVIGASPKG